MKKIHPPPAGDPKAIKMRNPLPPVALTALRTIQTTKVCPKGHEFFLEGQTPRGIFILYAGRVELSVTDAHGRQLVLATAAPGDVLGLSATVSGRFHEETAVAVVPCRIGFVKCPDFVHFLGHHPAAAFWVVQLLSDRVTTTLDQLSCIQCPQTKSLRQ
jgi:CRP/FNR family transcriptional regulator, cyclic AMP receptor protein